MIEADVRVQRKREFWRQVAASFCGTVAGLLFVIGLAWLA